jgi:hypothetical protein
MAQRRITYKGQPYDFPTGTTDAEIREALSAIPAEMGPLSQTPQQRRAELAPPIAPPVSVAMRPPLIGIRRPIQRAIKDPWSIYPSEELTSWLPMAGATAGTLTTAPTGPGALGGAIVGGTGGSLLEQGINAVPIYFGEREAPEGMATTPGKVMGQAAWTGLKEGILEGVMRGGGALVGKVGRRALQEGRRWKAARAAPSILDDAPPLPPRGPRQPTMDVAGVKIPLTASQSISREAVRRGKPPGRWQQLLHDLESYYGGLYAGPPIQAVVRAQESGGREVMRNVLRNLLDDAAKMAGAKPISFPMIQNALMRNWAHGRQAIRDVAGEIYEAVGKGPIPVELRTASQGVMDTLEDSLTRMTPQVRQALELVTGAKTRQGMSAETYDSIIKLFDLDEREIGKLLGSLPEGAAHLSVDTASTFKDVIAARSGLGKLAAKATDPTDVRELWKAYNLLDGSLKASMNPAQRASLEVADTQWRQSRIMDKVVDSFREMELKQAVGVSDDELLKDIIPSMFNTLISELADVKVVKEIGKVGGKELPSELDLLFPRAADRRAVRELSTFLSTDYDLSAITERLMRISETKQVGEFPMEVLQSGGNPRVVSRLLFSVGGILGLVHHLAKPGGIQEVLRFFKSRGMAVAPAAERLRRAMGIDLGSEPSPETQAATPIPQPLPPNVNIPVN